MRHCYQLGLLGNPTLSGTARLSFLVQGDGTLAEVDVSGLGDAEVEACIRGVFQQARFPARRASEHKEPPDILVHYPFHLKPSEPRRGTAHRD